ncbi:MAG: DNA polymerase III subunit gamma/tau [Luminiphilus sp.]|nr:DNA polymerase III subunit gamma/tau [Luminiphilus sp.]
MSYQVLARKWRPRTFQEMVGQQHVLRALVNALDNDRLHHAYLFTGTRGVGKTTVARILAKCLNCEVGVGSEPCGECGSCCEIAEGRSVDLIEVDAASRTKVEDTRELLDNVQYAPSRARFKIYLIDEVHMLSNHSFNALLKTLEEPPPHAKFLLATTDPQKLPATILSRCLQFNLKNMLPEQVVEHLEKILAEEAVEFENPALTLLGRAAAGSMRDALSLTDQAIAYGSGQLQEADVRDMLGTVDRGRVLELLARVAAGDAAEILACVDAIAEHAPDYASTLEEIISLLHQLTLAQMVPDSVSGDTLEENKIRELAGILSLDEAQLFYQFAINGRRDLPVAPDPRIALEMTLLRMIAFRPAEMPVPTKGGDGNPLGDAPARKKSDPPAPPVAKLASEPAAKAPQLAAAVVEPAAATVSLPSRTGDEQVVSADVAGDLPTTASWPAFFDELGLVGITQSVALHCELVAVRGRQLEFVIDSNNASLFQERQVSALEMAFNQLLELPVEVSVVVGEVGESTPFRLRQLQAAERQRAAELALEHDPQLAALLVEFDGKVVDGSIRPR